MIYKHYKGGLYRYLGLALNATNGEAEGQIMVVYQSLATGETFVREEKEFDGYQNLYDAGRDGIILKGKVKRFEIHQK